MFLFGNSRLVIRSATIEEIEAEKSAIETDVVRYFKSFWLLFSGKRGITTTLDVILVFVLCNPEIKDGEDH